ncbi:MAG: penicillin-binding protein, partial [Lachnospiraceae bacterium]|nr:penicillin-binding protein [Lachnospiraceae bacterium]
MSDLQRIRREIAELLRKLNPRIFLVIVFFAFAAMVMVYRLFELQVIRGEEYLNSFQLRIRREVSVNPTRGNIYDRNGELLAYNELAYSVVIRDVMAEESGKNAALNEIVKKTIAIIEENGDSVSSDFGIRLNEEGNYVFRYQGTSHLRFLADVYGYLTIDQLSEEERAKTPDNVIEDLSRRFGVGEYMEPGNRASFAPGLGYSARLQLQTVLIRYLMNLNSYQKYIPATIAPDVSPQTVATVMENSDILQGVSIEENTVRRYVDSKYFSQILGYTGKVSSEELENLRKEDPTYDANDTVGKAGIEASMELELQGKKGRSVVYVDNLGRVLDSSLTSQATPGNDIYLTLDKKLQIAAYDILEKYLSRILLEKIQPIKEYINYQNNSSDIVIPIYDVYFACIRNNIIDLSHFTAPDAQETEKAVQAAFETYRESALAKLSEEMHTTKTPYNALTKEYMNYESLLVSTMYDDGILMRDAIDRDDEVYVNWTVNETICLADFLRHALECGWIDVGRLTLTGRYADAEEVYASLVRYSLEQLSESTGFIKQIYRYMLLTDALSGSQICRLLLEQDLVEVDEEEKNQFYAGMETPYTFMLNRISDLDLTPAQLNLDPFSGSMVITDPNSGDVLAMVSYPSYDNNKMSNGVDPVYYEQLRNDASTPLINFATYQQTAPGSTFKMVSATAGLMEGVINLGDTIYCGGVFEKIGEPEPKCWIYPAASHGYLDVMHAIQHSCNLYFYEVGYRLGISNGRYVSDIGVAKLRQYASLYGLDVRSGVEIEEAAPRMATQDSVRAAIGQSDSGYTTVSLARYVSTVANGGTCYDLTLIDRITDSSGLVLSSKDPVIHNIIN